MSLSVLADLFADAGPAARLVGRPRGVAHIYVGPLTPSGRFAAAAGRTACRARTRRLSILAPMSCRRGEPSSRRVCARCSARLTPQGRAEHLPNRDAIVAAYGTLTLPQLQAAAGACTTPAESHQLGLITAVLYGQPLRHATNLSGRDAAVRDLHRFIETDRKRLVAALRTPEEIEAAAEAARRQVETTNRIKEARAREAAAARAYDRQARGQYLAPWERTAKAG
jgi:hypothetical protein